MTCRYRAQRRACSASGGHRPGTRRAELKAAFAALRASAGTSTETGRHALRLALVASIGEVVAQASGLPHGYWIVLTILIVLRPDYVFMIYRGVQRAAGTVIGGAAVWLPRCCCTSGPRRWWRRRA